jgi:hypothetical protein
MDVGSWSLDPSGKETITVEQCDECGIGWGQFTGWFELDEADR